jgi:hypothetical protein
MRPHGRDGARFSAYGISMRARQVHVTDAWAEVEEQLILLVQAITVNGHALLREVYGHPWWSALRRGSESHEHEDRRHWPEAREDMVWLLWSHTIF